MATELTGRYLAAYEFAVRTHVQRRVAPEDASLAEAYPKLTVLALSPDFRATFAKDIILAKQMQETGTATSAETFQRTSEIGKRLAEVYLFSKSPELRPTESEFAIAQQRVREKQLEDEREEKKTTA